MARFWERKIKQLRSRAVSFPDQAISHAASGFVVVAWPAAFEIDPDIPLRFDLDTLKEVVTKCERAR
jgi:hypothetical protein